MPSLPKAVCTRAVARTLRFEPGTIVVFDHGYNDYAWFAALDANGVYFVTRIKDNTDYGVLERRPVSSLRLNRGRRMTSSYSE